MHQFKGYYLWSIPQEERETVKEWIEEYKALKEKEELTNSKLRRTKLLEQVLFTGFRSGDNMIPSIYSIFPLPREHALREAAASILLVRIKLAKRYINLNSRKRGN